MTEAELLEQAAENIQTSIDSLSFVVSLIFAYLAGLYLFIRRTRLIVRMMAFFFYTISFAYVYLADVAARMLWDRYVRARDHALSDQDNTLPEHWYVGDPSNFLPYLDGLSYLLASTTWIGLFYLTFFYDWRIERGKKKAE